MENTPNTNHDVSINTSKKDDVDELPSQESNLYDVILVSPGWFKLAVVKHIKDLTCLSLKESKDLMDTTPSIILKGIEKTKALEILALFQEVGAEIELRPSK